MTTQCIGRAEVTLQVPGNNSKLEKISYEESKLRCSTSGLEISSVQSDLELKLISLLIEEVGRNNNETLETVWVGIELQASLNITLGEQILNPAEAYFLPRTSLEEESVDLEFLNTPGDTPWLGKQPIAESFTDAVVVTNNRFVSRNRSFLADAFLCRNENSEACLEVTDSPFSSSRGNSITHTPTLSSNINIPTNNDHVFFSVGTFFGVLGLLGLLVLYLSKSSFKDNEDNNLIHPIVSHHHDVSDKFSLFSDGKSVLYHQFSESDSNLTLETNRKFSLVDERNFRKVNTVISDVTDYSRVTENILRSVLIMGGTGEESIEVIEKIAAVLESQVEDNEIDQVKDCLSAFDSMVVPTIDLKSYLIRLVNGIDYWFEQDFDDSNNGMKSLYLALHYLRLLADTLNFKLTKYNIHQISSILMLVSAKFIEEKPLSNSYWAMVSGITCEKVVELEEILCFSLNFDFAVEEVELKKSLEPYFSSIL